MPDNHNINAKLLGLLKKGDREAFNVLIRLYYPRLMGYTRVMVEEEVARDIVQDVFLYLWDNRARIEFTPGLHSYLFKMCYSRGVDHLRRKKLIAKEDIPANSLVEDELGWLKSNTEDIIKVLSDRDLLKKVEDIIEELPDKRREVFKLSFFHEMNNAEISELLGMPRRTVESHLYLALKFLRGKIPTSELLGLLLLFAHIC